MPKIAPNIADSAPTAVRSRADRKSARGSTGSPRRWWRP